MDVTPIINRLTAQCPSFAQIIEPSQSSNPPLQDTQSALFSLLSSLVGGRMYPVQAIEGGAYPEIVYQLSSSSVEAVGGYEITRLDSYSLAVMTETYSELLTLQASIFSAMAGENISIVNAFHDYAEQEGLYVLFLDLSFSTLTGGTQITPAAYVYPVSRSAGESVFDNLIRQQVEAEYAVVVVTDADNMDTLLTEVQAALVGWQQSADHFEMEYANGASIESVGALAVWREVYKDAYFIQQS